MQFRSQKSIEFRNVKKHCKYCSALLKLNNTRDIQRKNYCSRSCRQKKRYELGEWIMDKIIRAGNTPEANAKKSMPKDKHPRWLGDRKLLRRPRTSYEGNIWRKSVFSKDNYTCQTCGQIGGQLQAHHVKNYWLFPELRWDILNGTTLCVDCHKKTDDYGWKAINIRRKK